MWRGFLENTENVYSWNTLHEQFRLKGLMLSLSFFSITCIISVSAQINWRKLTGKYQSSCCTSLKLQRARWGESRSSFLAFITNTRGSFQFQREVVVLVSSYVSYFEFERQNMVMHEGFPQWWPELLFLCGASRGWEDDAPPGARHVDGAAQLQYPRDRFLFLSIPLCLFHAYHSVCWSRYRLRLNPNLSQGWYYSPFLSPLICSRSSLHALTALLRAAATDKTLFLSCKRRKDKRRTVRDCTPSHNLHHFSARTLFFSPFDIRVSSVNLSPTDWDIAVTHQHTVSL